VRPKSRLSRLEGIEAEVVEGDILDPRSLAHALSGCRAVVHLASPSAWRDIASPLLSEVVEGGPENLLSVARDHPDLRAVYVSSVAAVNGSDRPVVFHEESPFTLSDGSLAYAHAKRAAEALCRDAARSGVDVVIVNPAETYGPGDLDLLTAGALVDFATGSVVLVTEGGTSITHVDDVATGITGALDSGRTGERYILGGENLTVRALAELTLEILDRSSRIVPLPRAPLKAWARAAVAYGVPFPVEPRMIPYATRYWFTDSARARKELGYRPRPAREVLTPTLAWLRETGRLPA
jgi:dihydroflavonol-4-reductase